MRFLCNRLCGLNEFRCCDRISKIFWRRNKAILEVTLSCGLHVDTPRRSRGGDGFPVDYLRFFADRTRNWLDVGFCRFAIIIVLRCIDIPYNAMDAFNQNIKMKINPGKLFYIFFKKTFLFHQTCPSTRQSFQESR